MKLKELLQKYPIEEIIRKYTKGEIYLTQRQLDSLLKKSKKGE